MHPLLFFIFSAAVNKFSAKSSTEIRFRIRNSIELNPLINEVKKHLVDNIFKIFATPAKPQTNISKMIKIFTMQTVKYLHLAAWLIIIVICKQLWDLGLVN